MIHATEAGVIHATEASEVPDQDSQLVDEASSLRRPKDQKFAAEYFPAAQSVEASEPLSDKNVQAKLGDEKERLSPRWSDVLSVGHQKLQAESAPDESDLSKLDADFQERGARDHVQPQDDDTEVSQPNAHASVGTYLTSDAWQTA